MSGFSNLIDISSFFIGILINLLLVALICYYFKRKIDNLEVAQSEQAKMLYTIISQQENKLVNVDNDERVESMGMLQNLNLEQLSGDYNGYEESNNYVQSGENIQELDNDDIDSGDESDDESDSESENEDDTNVDSDEDTILAGEETNEELNNNDEQVVDEVKSIKYNVDEDLEQVYDYEKMTVRELKTIADNMGIKNIKKNVKKQDLINILVTQSNQNQQIDFVKNDESVMEQEEEEEVEEIVDVDDVVEEPIVVHQEDSDGQDEGLVIELDEDEDINIGNDNEELIS